MIDLGKGKSFEMLKEWHESAADSTLKKNFRRLEDYIYSSL